MIDASRSKRQQRGFTLIEMIIVCAMISILLGVMVPIYKIHVLHANEAVLKEDLFNMRQAIDNTRRTRARRRRLWMTS
jgi:general secretion pathway protein G